MMFCCQENTIESELRMKGNNEFINLIILINSNNLNQPQNQIPNFHSPLNINNNQSNNFEPTFYSSNDNNNISYSSY